MATSVNITFSKPKEEVFNASLASVAILGYSIISTNKDSGTISFETGMSMKSWAGQSLSCTIISISDTQTQLIISGAMKQHGAQVQVFSWGEAESIAQKVIQQVALTLGEIVTSGDNKKGCFIATAVYGSAMSHQVIQFYEIRDNYLNKSVSGRIFIRLYYLVSPAIARFIENREPLKNWIRKLVLNPLLKFWHSKIN